MARTLGRSDRITRQKELARVFQQGGAAADPLLRLHVLANSLGRSRLAVAVSARHRGSVRRNRIKRLCREAFRTCRQELPGGHDYVMVPRPGGDFTVEGLRSSLRELSGRLIQEPKL